MSESELQIGSEDQSVTSLGTKLLNVFVSPSQVFEEVVAAPPSLANWIVPVALVCLSSLATLTAITSPDLAATAANQLVDTGKVNQSQATTLSAQWQNVSRIALVIAPFAATIWSAFVVWFIGKVFLKSQFAFRKALEVTALSGAILVLGAAVTGLLAAATGETSARPALSLMCLKLPQESLVRTACGLFDCTHLWATGVLAVGLSKLAGVTFKESAFWVFGYWFLARGALLLLG
jgi:hypothetical protein